MKRPRGLIVGTTDYTGFTVDEIVEHLEDWQVTTKAVSAKMQEFVTKVSQVVTQLSDPDDVIAFCAIVIDRLSRFEPEFERLKKELPHGIRARHITSVQQLWEMARSLDGTCIHFKRDHISRGLPDESVRPLLDEIYSTARDQALYYVDLSNLVGRLKALVLDSGEPSIP